MYSNATPRTAKCLAVRFSRETAQEGTPGEGLLVPDNLSDQPKLSWGASLLSECLFLKGGSCETDTDSSTSSPGPSADAINSAGHITVTKSGSGWLSQEMTVTHSTSRIELRHMTSLNAGSNCAFLVAFCIRQDGPRPVAHGSRYLKRKHCSQCTWAFEAFQEKQTYF